MRPRRFLVAAALLAATTAAAFAATNPDAAYFVLDGNPVSAKYLSHRLVRLPTQDAGDADAIRSLESVRALSGAARLRALDATSRIDIAHLSSPQPTSYGTSMFEVTVDRPEAKTGAPGWLVWSGSTPFKGVALHRPGTDSRLRRALEQQSRDLIAPRLDLRGYAPVARQLELEGPVRVRDYGSPDGAPHLAVIDIVWHIKDLPEALSDRGIDSTSPFMRAEFVVDRRTGRPVFRNIVNVGDIEDREFLLFKEPGGPLLMAVRLDCLDGAEPMVFDLEHETYGTGHPGDVPDLAHCFPAQ